MSSARFSPTTSARGNGRCLARWRHELGLIEQAQQLTVGMVIGCTITPLFDALAAFHRAHPGVEISLLEDNSDRLVDGSVMAPSTWLSSGPQPPRTTGWTR